MDVYAKLKERNYEIREATPKGGIYSPIRYFGQHLAYTSGTGPASEDGGNPLGKLGAELTLEEGREAAKSAMLNIISNLHHQLGDLSRIKSFIKILAFVASDDSFTNQPKVVDGASELLLDIFGSQIGLPARSAIGVNVLPGNIPVEIELLLELND